MVQRRRDTPPKQPAEDRDAIHLKHLQNAYTGVWDDTHRVKQLHYCLYEPWREWVESCCDDFVALIRRKGYTSVLSLMLSHSSADIFPVDEDTDTLIFTQGFSKNILFESLCSTSNLVGERGLSLSQKQPSEVLKNEMSLTQLLEALMGFVLLSDDEVSNTLFGVSSARQQNTTTVEEGKRVKPPPQALATSVTSSSHLLFSHFTHEFLDIKKTTVQPCVKKTRSEHCSADDSSRGNGGAARGLIDVDCLLDFLLELVTCPPAALGSRLSLLLGRGLQWKGQASKASIVHNAPNGIVHHHHSLASERLPFLSCVSIDDDNDDNDNDDDDNDDDDDGYYYDTAAVQKEWRAASLPSISPCGSAPFSVRLTSNMPCEVFEGSTTLFSEMAATITPSDYQAMLSFLSCLEEVFALVRRSIAAIIEENGGNYGGRSQLPSGGGLRRQRELAASFLQDLERFLKFLRVAKTHLIIEDDGDPSDPFQLKTNAGARDGTVAVVEGIWDSDSTVSAILKSKGPSGDFHAALFGMSTAPSFESTVREGATATATTANPTAPSLPQCDGLLTAVSLLQRVVLRGLHFAPQNPKWDDDEGRYAFESLIDGTDAYGCDTWTVDKASHQESRRSSTDEGAGPSAENRLSRMSRRSRAVLPPSFFSGPSGPQCCVGSFIGFGLVMKALREGNVLKSVASQVGSDKGWGDGEAIASNSTTCKKRGRRADSRPRRYREMEQSAKDTVCDTLADDAISLNGPVIILGMGGNVALNLLAEQLLAPTAAGEAFLKANPLFSLHVVELEPSVMRTCAANGLLPGYDHLTEGSSVKVSFSSYFTDDMVLLEGEGKGEGEGNGERGNAKYKDIKATHSTLQPMEAEVVKTKESPSWSVRADLEVEVSSAVGTTQLWDTWRKNIGERVFYHVGVDALTTNLSLLASSAVFARFNKLIGDCTQDTKSSGAPLLASPLIFFDCFDPVVNTISSPTTDILSRLKQWLCPENSGLLLVNCHFSWDYRDASGPNAGRGFGAGEALAPFVSVFGESHPARTDRTVNLSSGGFHRRRCTVDVWQFGDWAQYGIAAFASPDPASTSDATSSDAYAEAALPRVLRSVHCGGVGEEGEEKEEEGTCEALLGDSSVFSAGECALAMSKLIASDVWDKLVCGSVVAGWIRTRGSGALSSTRGVRRGGQGSLGAVVHIRRYVEHVLRFRGLQRSFLVGLRKFAAHKSKGLAEEQRRGVVIGCTGSRDPYRDGESPSSSCVCNGDKGKEGEQQTHERAAAVILGSRAGIRMVKGINRDYRHRLTNKETHCEEDSGKCWKCHCPLFSLWLSR